MRAFITAIKRWPGWITWLMLLIGWEAAARFYPPVVLPSPAETVRGLVALADAGHLGQTLAFSFVRFAAGFGIAFAAGTGLGVGAGLHNGVYAAVRPAVALFQAVPPVSWILLAIIWLGANGGAQVMVVSVALFPVFFFNSVEGIRQVPRDLLEMAAVFRVRLRKQILDIYWPALRPYWSAACIINIGSGWKTVVMSELISGQSGVGAAMNTAKLYLKTEELMAWTLLVACMGMSLERLARRFLDTRREETPVCDSTASHSATTGGPSFRTFP